MFGGCYANKKVVVTGHTGFKGSWLTAWLLQLGAKVVGISDTVPTQPANFDILGLKSKITHYEEDVRNIEQIREILLKEKPDFVFHLAAQAIVSESYADPIRTLSVNIMGTASVLNAMREFSHDCVGVFITSDKCYENKEWPWGYREDDQLGGKDIYSSSKASAENTFYSFFHSFFAKQDRIRIASARAGNVIGGGDWAKDRIVVDATKAWAKGEAVKIRSPRATRPWQHVLEPLSGYLQLGQRLSQSADQHGQSFNFGPRAEQNRTVAELLGDLSREWGFKSPDASYEAVGQQTFHEAGLLKLSCDKALFHLKWNPTLNYVQTVEFVSQWYFNYYKKPGFDMLGFTLGQIERFQSVAREQNQPWTQA